MPDHLLVIVGPTASGKSEVGLLAAQALGGEIISADSMQVYRGMDIGTAKPTPEQRARVRHHLIDVVEPEQPFSVADYQRLAWAAIDDVFSRGRQPVVVGGSGLYVRALIGGLRLALAPPDPELRRRLARHDAASLHARLSAVDPWAAARIHPHDEKRIIRALEVYEQTGAPISALHSVDPAAPPRYNTRQFGLTWPRLELYRRIEARVDRMMAEGLLDEVKALLARGCDETLVSMKGLGYAQLLAHLRGACTYEEAVKLLKRDTRRFAKRQLTWFRADQRIEWVDMSQVGGPERAAEIIVERFGQEWE